MSAQLEFAIAPEFSALRGLRDVIRQRVRGLGMGRDSIDRLVLAVDEIVSNAIEHGDGYRVAGHVLSLRLGARGGDLDLEFVDPDVPDRVVREMRDLLRASRDRRPGLLDERGRGFFLVNDSLDHVEIELASGSGLTLRGRFVGVLG